MLRRRAGERRPEAEAAGAVARGAARSRRTAGALADAELRGAGGDPAGGRRAGHRDACWPRCSTAGRATSPAAARRIAGRVRRSGRGFELRRAAGGWRLYTRPEYAAYVERFVLDGQSVRLTQAALETLAVVAYKQPVTRSRISAIRGVNCDGVVRTLVTRGLVEECGTRAGERGVPVPDHHPVPGEARPGLGRRAAAAGPVPARRRERIADAQR